MDLWSGRVGLASVFVLLAAFGAPPGSRAETNTQAFLGQGEITPRARSLAIERRDLVGGCGSNPAVDGNPVEWQGTPTWIAGTGRYDRQEYIWTDYPFDDDGTGTFQYPGEGEALIEQAGTVGTATPRMQRYGANAADVVELRVRADSDSDFVHFLIRFNFLNAIDSTVVGLGFDTDGNPTEGISEWPHGARLRSPGMDLFVTAYGECARVVTEAGEKRIDDSSIDGAIRVNTRQNLFELALPRSLFGNAGQVRMVGGSGLWDPASASWMSVQAVPRTASNASDQPRGAKTMSDPAVFNLLFRDDETTIEGCEGATSPSPDCQLGTPRTFQSRRQHETLSGGTTGDYAITIDLDSLAIGNRIDEPIVRRGSEKDFTRVYRSQVDMEGVLAVAYNAAVLLSRYQPYGIYLPTCYENGCPGLWPEGRPPLAVLPHGGGQSHLGSAPRPSIPEGGTDLYGIETAFARIESAVGAVLIRPLGRGQRPPWWRGLGEVDVLEIVHDTESHYDTDPERRVIVGASLGGYSTLRLGSLYPDLWSGAFAHCPAEFENSISARDVGNVDPSTQPFVVDAVMPSLLNIPLRQASGTMDPLVPIVANHRIRDTALAAGLDLRYTEYFLGSHCFDLATLSRPWVENHVPETVALLTQPRARTPARIRYRIDPRHYLASTPKASEPLGVFDVRDVGIAYRGAYWVSGLEVRPEVEELALGPMAPGGADTSVVGAIDVATRARSDWDDAVLGCDNVPPFGVGVGPGGNPDLTPPSPTPHLYQCQTRAFSLPEGSVLDLDVRNLSKGAIDLAGAALDSAATFNVRAKGDGPFLLTLVGVETTNVTGSCVLPEGVLVGLGATSIDLQLGDSVCEVTVTQ